VTGLTAEQAAKVSRLFGGEVTLPARHGVKDGVRDVLGVAAHNTHIQTSCVNAQASFRGQPFSKAVSSGAVTGPAENCAAGERGAEPFQPEKCVNSTPFERNPLYIAVHRARLGDRLADKD
jgi:hypothetical protein